MEQTDILIPGQHYEWAKRIVEYVEHIFAIDNPSLIKKIAKEIVNAKYWEAYDCGDDTRMEYWRIVLNCLDLF